MGLIKAAAGATGGTFAEQWKEFFYCDAINKDTLVVKGKKKVTKRGSNTKGEDNIISSGSVIAVADGQCMIIVEQGKIVEVCAEPGEFIYDASTEPSIFNGKLGAGIKNTFKSIGKRFTFGGEAPKDQRVYYFNTKEIIDNKFGTLNPIMFEVVNNRIGMVRTVDIRCNGTYSYKITDPLLFYTNICGNISGDFEKQEIESQLKSEISDALQPAFAVLSSLELRPAQIPAHTTELKDALNNALKSTWTEKRGITIESIAINPIRLSDEDTEKIKQMEDDMTLGSNPFMMAGRDLQGRLDAMKTAAGNSAGPMTGFMGIGMMNNMGGQNMMNSAQSFYQMGIQNQNAQQVMQTTPPAQNSWKCSCGNIASGKFCPECGLPKPQEINGWKCVCGAINKGKFCQECGSKKPADALLYQCDKCGWQPEDPHNPPKFCPECGDIFNENDVK